MGSFGGALGQGLQALGWLSNAVQVQRSEQEQARVDAATSRLALYCLPACPYCVRVSRCIRRLDLKIRRLDIHADAAAAGELRREGGLYQAPCLKITEPNGDIRWMYESGDIIAYLRQHYQD